MENLIECKLTKEQLKVIYDNFCVYENGSETGEIPLNCDKCFLRDIEWVACIKEWKMIDEEHTHSKEIVRDLCFAIWHDGILTKNPKHIHHYGN